MFKVNENYLKLPGSYLFSTIGKKVSAYQAANPDKQIIRLGIGDVTQPLAPVIIEAMHKAVDEMGHAETFHGYAPDLGYEFLRSAMAKNDYQDKGCDIQADEIFISDGAKSSCAAKIAASVDAGILGYKMYLDGQEFKDGDGIVVKGVENTIRNVARLGKEGMKETDKEIIKIMTNC